MTLRFYMNKNEYMLPIMLVMRALKPTTDKEIMNTIYAHAIGQDQNVLLMRRIEQMIRLFSVQHSKILKGTPTESNVACLEFIGEKFSSLLQSDDTLSNAQKGRALLNKVILAHLDSNESKYDLLAFMVHKLFSFTDPHSPCGEDNPDIPSMHQVLLPGHVILIAIKDKLDDFLTNLKWVVKNDIKAQSGTDIAKYREVDYWKRMIAKGGAWDLGKRMAYMIATGNLVSKTGSLDLQQASGFSVVADRLNFYRFISQ